MTQAELRSLLIAAGLPASLWQLPDSFYEAFYPESLVQIYEAWVAARPDSLCTMRAVGGGKTRRVPLWIADAGDCDNLALGLMAWADVGNALAAAKGPARGGLACGVLFFTAGPARAENYNVAGPHAINWMVLHDRTVAFFEPGVGSFIDLNPAERSSAWFGLAA